MECYSYPDYQLWKRHAVEIMKVIVVVDAVAVGLFVAGRRRARMIRFGLGLFEPSSAYLS